MKTEELKRSIANGEKDELLKDIYVDEKLIAHQRERYVNAISRFVELYGDRDIEIYSAPGRTEVGGNHTDHQHGQVLAASVNLDVIAICSKTDDGIIKIVSDSYNINPVNVNEPEKRDEEEGTSEALIRGVASKIISDGHKAGGFVSFMTSEVLVGAGLSSSAAFEVAVGTILSGMYNDMKLSPVYIAQISQYAENVYFGKPCGLMDQMASSVGCLVNIDFKDPSNPVVNRVDVDFDSFGHSLCIVDTKGDHSNLTDEYAAIPTEMKKVAAFFGKDYLREVDPKDFYENIAQIRKTSGDRAIVRAIHFFADHDRVGKQVEALKKGDFDRFKDLVTESGDSSYKYLQNVFAVTDVQNQSVSIGLALTEKLLKEKAAYRVHGGGFAGTIQAFVPNDLVDEYKKEIEKCFGKDTCHVLKIRKYGGMKVL
ncbi:MAG: galactokinase [Lachnospiraceae bacterium]|nr:galactokinase [Lachnospiraceae bacterium]